LELISRAKFISKTIQEAENSYMRNLDESAIVNELQARNCVLNSDLRAAEYIMLDSANIESALHL
jgi:hypothetical protein